MECNYDNGTELLAKYWNKGGFAMCTAGEARAVINGQNFILTRGCAFIVTPLVQISSFIPSEDYGDISLIGELKNFYPVFRMIANTPIPLSVRSNPCWQLSEHVVCRISGHNDYAAELQRRIDDGSSHEERQLLAQQIILVKRQMMLEAVCDHIRHYPVDSRAADRQSAAVFRFFLSLHEDFRRERRVSKYAADAGLSAGHFSAVVKNATGKTPSQWIADITVSYARILLEQGGRSIKEIAAELNFPEQFTFRKYFKHYVGVSPKVYSRSRRPNE